jgi:hypothetical protein
MTKKMMAKLIGIDSKKMVKILIVGTLVIVVTLIGIFILNNDFITVFLGKYIDSFESCIIIAQLISSVINSPLFACIDISPFNSFKSFGKKCLK